MTQEDEGGQLPAFLTDPRGVLRRRWPSIVAQLLIQINVRLARIKQAASKASR